ncbi:MAG: NAD(P)/FAD-dependent oxidoreductase [Eubacterium sp.]
MYDIVIIGAGIIGTSIARELSRYQLNIALLEKENDISMGSTKANSAIVHGGYAEAHAKVKGRLCYKGRTQFAKLNEELNFGFDPIGSLVLAFEEDQKKGLEDLMANGILNGLEDLELLDHDAIMSIEPHVNPEVKYALYCKGAGVCSPYEMAIALAENAVKNGVKLFLETGVKDINRNGDDFDVISENGDIFNTHYVINAAGLYSDRISAMVGVDYFKILPRSGEYLLMVRGSGSAINQVLFQMPTKMGKGILVTPTYHGNLLIGPDAVNEGEADRDTHAERLLRIFKEATLTTDKLNIKQFIRSFTGVRAVSSTDDFIIEESTVPHFINVSGIQSPGITSSPAIAQMVRDILANAGLKLEADPNFDPYRKPIINRKELKPMKEILPLLDLPLGDQDRMICRCEQVSETTILDAMRRGIPVTTIDGIKRRTRAGMGWCQGTFCRPRVAEVMSKELGREINAEFDIEHSGVNRIGKNEIVTYIEEHIED